MSDVARAEIAPVEAEQRIKTLDVLLGLAILGILAVNAPFFSAPWQTALNPALEPLAINDATAWSWFVPHVFFEAKFITLFSLLFGASLFLVGGERSDLERGKVLRRRLVWMLAFGILHGAATVWALVRFDAPVKEGNGERIEGRMVEGNVDDLRATWHLQPTDDGNTILRSELLVVPKLKLPASVITPELEYAADQAATNARDRSEAKAKSAGAGATAQGE